MSEFDRRQIEVAEWEGFGMTRTVLKGNSVDKYQLEVAEWEGFGAVNTPTLDEVKRQKEAILERSTAQSMGESPANQLQGSIQEMTLGFPIYPTSS